MVRCMAAQKCYICVKLALQLVLCLEFHIDWFNRFTHFFLLLRSFTQWISSTNQIFPISTNKFIFIVFFFVFGMHSQSQLFSIIVFGCISSQGWRVDDKSKKDICIYNDNPTACNYGVTVGVIGFLASMGFIAGEYLFEQMSSVKTRKHYVLADLGFSGEFFLLQFYDPVSTHLLLYMCTDLRTSLDLWIDRMNTKSFSQKLCSQTTNEYTQSDCINCQWMRIISWFHGSFRRNFH